MSDTPTTEVPAHSTIRVLAALADLGEATAAAIAEHTQLGYSTVTPKLRAWETSGHAEKYRDAQNQTLWRLTANGRAATAPSGGSAETIKVASSTAAPLTTDDVTNLVDFDAPAAATDEAGTPGRADGDESPDADRADQPRDAIVDVPTPADPAEPALVEQPNPATAGPLDDESGNDNAPGIPDTAVTGSSPTPTGDPADTGDGTAPVAVPAGDATSETTVRDRRSTGSLRGAILDVLDANPGRGYKVSELCRLIDRANEGTAAKKASQGAVANAAHKLVQHGRAVLLVERPATFGLPAADA